MIINKFEFPKRHQSVWQMRPDGVKFLSNDSTINDLRYTRCDPPEGYVAPPAVEELVPAKRGRPKKVQET